MDSSNSVGSGTARHVMVAVTRDVWCRTAGRWGPVGAVFLLLCFVAPALALPIIEQNTTPVAPAAGSATPDTGGVDLGNGVVLPRLDQPLDRATVTVVEPGTGGIDADSPFKVSALDLGNPTFGRSVWQPAEAGLLPTAARVFESLPAPSLLDQGQYQVAAADRIGPADLVIDAAALGAIAPSAGVQVPEPATVWLLALALIGMGLVVRWRRGRPGSRAGRELRRSG